MIAKTARGGVVRSGLTGQAASKDLTCAVVVVSHNYGCYLEDALHSISLQDHPPDEILVVDDSSVDDTVEVATKLGVRCVSVHCGQPFYARAEGLSYINSDIVCFLDADDVLSPTYLSEGMRYFVNDHRVGIVYSDMEMFGAKQGRLEKPLFDRDSLHLENYIHAGSLVSRQALLSSRAFEAGGPPSELAAEDWLVWRRVVEQGWTARKQGADYWYRQHRGSRFLKVRHASYYDKAAIASETLTLFVPLAGRHKMWRRFSKFLDQQEWPKNQVQLVLMDTSGDRKFHKRVRNWVSHCAYSDVRVLKFDPGEPKGSADDDRYDEKIWRRVQRAVCRIYNEMREMSLNPYVWILEDDVFPPTDCAERLLRGFESDVVSVSGAVLSRLHNHFIHWDKQQRNVTEVGEGVIEAGGNGFGCVILRRSTIKDSVFRFDPSFCHGEYDVSFYKRLNGARTLVDWDVLCQHG